MGSSLSSALNVPVAGRRGLLRRLRPAARASVRAVRPWLEGAAKALAAKRAIIVAENFILKVGLKKVSVGFLELLED